MEALEPARPLGFLDIRIKCGNILLGATPDLVAAGIPDDAFKRIEGSRLRAPNRLVASDQATRHAYCRHFDMRCCLGSERVELGRVAG
jgi:hypothetical protein